MSSSTASRARKDALALRYGSVEENYEKLPTLLRRFKSADNNFEWQIMITDESNSSSSNRPGILHENVEVAEKAIAEEAASPQNDQMEDESFLSIRSLSHYAPNALRPREVFTHCFVQLPYAQLLYKHGMRIISIDGAHSKTIGVGGGGCYFVAVTTLPSSHILPLCISYSGMKENSCAWNYFLGKLKHLAPDEANEFCLMSDRGTALVETIESNYENIDKFLCSRHVCQNAKKYAGYSVGEVDIYVDWLAKSCNYLDYLKVRQEWLAKTGNVSKVTKVLQYLEESRQFNDDWALSAPLKRMDSPRPRGRFGITLNNASESYNNVLKEARNMPLAHAFENIINSAMKAYKECKDEVIHKICARYEVERELHPDLNDFLASVRREICPGRLADKMDEHTLLCEEYSFTVTEMLSNETTIIWTASRISSVEGEVKRVVSFKRVAHNAGERAFNCSCELPYQYGIPCMHVQAVLKYAHESRSANRPQFRYTDAIEPQLTVGYVMESLSYDYSRLIAFDNHNLLAEARANLQHEALLLPHSEVSNVTSGAKKARGKRKNDRGVPASSSRILSTSEGQIQLTVRTAAAAEVGSDFSQQASSSSSLSYTQVAKKKRAMTCQKCGQSGHNKATCERRK